MSETDKARIDYLRTTLREHNDNYYILNMPTISDRDFDALMAELIELEKRNPDYYDETSPTQRVGSDLGGGGKGFKSVKHARRMMSLSNTYSVDEVSDFLSRVCKALGRDNVDIVGEMKFDGTSISITYEHGKLVRAVTRGDGERGDDVTANVRTIHSIPHQLDMEQHPDIPDTFEVRGEILLPWKKFEELNREREFNEDTLFANPRNAAAGTLKTLDSREVARRGLDAYMYYLLADNLGFSEHYQSLQALKRWGFKVSDEAIILHTIAEVQEFIAYWDKKRRELPVATDGLVFKVNELASQQALGATAKSPRWAVAYKFEAERASSRLRSVSFETGRMGTITPVANLDAVFLSGTYVRRASLHNEDIIRSLDIHEGDMLYVEKGGEIIPKIVGVDIEQRQPGSKRIEFVKNCPCCGSALVRKEGEAAWVCPNSTQCPVQIVGKIAHFVGRRMMNIDGIGEEVCEQLYSTGLVRNPADLYDLDMQKLLSLERFKQKSAERILKGIRQSLSVEFERVVFALSIPNVGETTAKLIARYAGDIDTLMDMTTEQWLELDEIGPIIASSIVSYFQENANREMVRRLRDAGVQMAIEKPSQGESSETLKGISIVISGVFQHHSRDEYKAMIELHGGKNVGSISAKTSFILAGDNMGPSKLEKATKLGVRILSEQEFLDMISQK